MYSVCSETKGDAIESNQVESLIHSQLLKLLLSNVAQEGSTSYNCIDHD
jgi:hypothetical protein